MPYRTHSFHRRTCLRKSRTFEPGGRNNNLLVSKKRTRDPVLSSQRKGIWGWHLRSGEIGFAQSPEVVYLEEKGFCSAFLSKVSIGGRDSWWFGSQDHNEDHTDLRDPLVVAVCVALRCDRPGERKRGNETKRLTGQTGNEHQNEGNESNRVESKRIESKRQETKPLGLSTRYGKNQYSILLVVHRLRTTGCCLQTRITRVESTTLGCIGWWFALPCLASQGTGTAGFFRVSFVAGFRSSFLRIDVQDVRVC